jgi:EpsI family protein
MIKHLLITSAILLGSAGYIAHATESEKIPLAKPLATLPIQVDGWTGREATPFTPDVLKVLGVDDYVNRVYVASRTPFISLYVGYYQSQRQGDTMHSPLNCLPGAGWEPIEQRRKMISVVDQSGARRTIDVNQFVIQKGLDRQLVLYWYQSHGRVIANEYKSRIFMVYDAMRLNRTDGAMVRVITPLADTEGDLAPAIGRATRFIQALFPTLTNVLPS